MEYVTGTVNLCPKELFDQMHDSEQKIFVLLMRSAVRNFLSGQTRRGTTDLKRARNIQDRVLRRFVEKSHADWMAAGMPECGPRRLYAEESRT